MSGWLGYVTTPEFWAGGVLLGSLSSGITFFSTRSSDRRKFKHELSVLTHKEEREDKLREQQNLYDSGTEFAQVCTDILIATIDIKGVFNTIRDWFYNRTGADDPKADEKFDHSLKVMEAQNRIAVPINKLKMVAPPNIVDAAMRVSAAVMTTVRQTTEPFAGRVAHKAASEELNNFINVFRQEIGKEEYTNEEAQEQVNSFLTILQKQTDDFVVEAREEMRAAGFKTTPWDNYKRKSA